MLNFPPRASECGFGDRQLVLGFSDGRFHRTPVFGSLFRAPRLFALPFRLRLSIDATGLRRTSRGRGGSGFNRARVAMIATRRVSARGLTGRGWIHRDARERLEP